MMDYFRYLFESEGKIEYPSVLLSCRMSAFRLKIPVEPDNLSETNGTVSKP